MYSPIILSSLAVVIVTYIFVSMRERNYVNVLTPFLVFNVPAYYILELIYETLFDVPGSIYAYLFCYSAYAIGFVAMAVGYLAFPARWLPIMIQMPRLRMPFAPFLFLLIGFLLYLPVLVQHSDLIASPREIYMVTRTGFGIQFFLSTFSVYFSLILLLFSRRVPWLFASLFVLVSMVTLYLHGSKAHVLYFMLIALYFAVFVKGWRFSFRRVLMLGIAFTAGMILLFYVTLPQTMKEDLIVGIASYSDYTRNVALVIDDNALEPQFGRLTAETELFTLVPRAVFPDKPKDFGSYWLAKRYYPEWFASDTGSPAFGIGVQYADFGPLAFAWHILAQLLTGIFVKVLVTRLRLRPDAGTFVLLLPLLHVELIPAGASLPLIVYYPFAMLANVLTTSAAAERLVNRTGSVPAADGLMAGAR